MARDTNFYYSFLVLPSSQRRAIVAVWDFCRAVDDAVDDPERGADAAGVEAALRFWRAEIARVFEGQAPESPQGRAVQPLVARFDLPRQPFEDLVDGVAMDVGTRRYATFDELREYCYRVASTVGLICVAIFGCRSEQSRRYAIELGLALQLTNILRDVAADLGRGRLYIPLEDLAAHACTEADLRAGLAGNVAVLLACQANRAREHYARARALLPRSERRQLVAAEIMGAIYRGILARIERRGYDVFSSIVRVPRPQRAAIAAGTWLRVMSGLG
jgi:phytoene synthase